MIPKTAKFLVVAVLILFLQTYWASAQDSAATLSGTINDASGKGLAKAKVSAKNVASGAITETVSDIDGHYSISGLAAGDYELTATSGDGGVGSEKVTLPAGTQQVQDLKLRLPQQAPENLPNAPAPKSQDQSQSGPSLEDLGFSKSEEQGNAREQALLDKRTHMLKIHQRMGLITTIPLVATVILGPGAGGKSEGTANRDAHVALGALTGDLYGITAWYAIRAPRIKGTQKRGPIRFHEAMAWIHGPGMIATPILGALAFEQKNNGQKVHGVAQAHGPVAIVTAGAFGAALLSVSLKF